MTTTDKASSRKRPRVTLTAQRSAELEKLSDQELVRLLRLWPDTDGWGAALSIPIVKALMREAAARIERSTSHGSDA